MELGMADYREISQTYAQGAIKAAFAVNGGAAVVVLSQFGSLAEIIEPKTVACAMLTYVFGTLFSAAAWVMAFLSTRHVDRTERGEDLDYRTANNYQALGLIFIAISLVAFLVGALILVTAL